MHHVLACALLIDQIFGITEQTLAHASYAMQVSRLKDLIRSAEGRAVGVTPVEGL